MTNTDQQKKLMVEKLWLSYFNKILYRKGVITEAECNRIVNMIASRGISGNNVT